MKKSRPRVTRHGSVQAGFVPVREVQDNMLSLAVPQAPHQRLYRAVVSVSGINYGLKSEAEQRRLNDAFRLLLAGLSHPVQVLVRIVPLDVERSHLHQFALDPTHPITRLPFMQDYLARWQEMASSYVSWWRAFAASRALVERRFYLILPAEQDASSDKEEPSVSFSLFSRLFGSLRREDRRKQREEQARQTLALRSTELIRQLAGVGLEARRLETEELMHLEYETLMPERASAFPLASAHLAGIGHLFTTEANEEMAIPERDAEEAGAKKDMRALLPSSRGAIAVSDKRSQGSPPSGVHAGEPVGEPVGQSWQELADLLAPGGITLGTNTITLDDEVQRVFALRGLPRYVPPGWLAPLFVDLDEPMEISLYFEPREQSAMIKTYQRRLYEMESSELVERGKGRHDYDRAQVHSDVAELITRLVSGEERMLDVSLYVRLSAKSKRELDLRTRRVLSVCHTMLLTLRPCLFEQDRGLRTCLPHATHELRGMGEGLFTLPATVASTFFPFLSRSLTHSGGILEGITEAQEPLLMDRWAKAWRNPHRLIVGSTGSGKSMKIKEDVVRLDLLYNHPHRLLPDGAQQVQIGLQQIVIDVEGECFDLCERRGGQWIRLAPGSRHQINLFDLPQRHDPARGSVLSDQLQFLRGALQLMLTDRSPGGEPGIFRGEERTLIDLALLRCYEIRGITEDVATHHRPPPVLADLYQVLTHELAQHDRTGLAYRLRPYVEGSLAGMFSGQTNVSFEAPIVVLDLYDLKDELRPLGIYLITHLLWTLSFESHIPRHFVLDEMQTLYDYPEGRAMIEQLFQRGRKRFVALSGVVQSPQKIKDSPLLANCQMLIIMAQEPTAIDAVTAFAHLSPPEVARVQKCQKGDGLVIVGEKRFFVHFRATDAEYWIATTDPLDRQEERLRYLQQIEGETSLSLSQEKLPDAQPVPLLSPPQSSRPLWQDRLPESLSRERVRSQRSLFIPASLPVPRIPHSQTTQSSSRPGAQITRDPITDQHARNDTFRDDLHKNEQRQHERRTTS